MEDKKYKISLSDIIGHEKNLGILKKFALSGKTPHALLFSGHSGVGKRKTAFAFASMLSCLEPESEGACGKCIACRKIKNMSHPGINFVVSPKNEGSSVEFDFKGRTVCAPNIMPNKGSKLSEEEGAKGPSLTVKINISQIRELKRLSYLKAAGEKGKKIFIIDDASRISPQGMNSLLKILEEPPAETYIILITSREDMLLPTIVSRCQRIEFGPLNFKQIKEFARLKGVEAGEELIEASLGSPGKLLKLAALGSFDIPDTEPEDIFTAASKWAGKSRQDNLHKLKALMSKEAAGFRKNPNRAAYEKIILIEESVNALERNANVDLTLSSLFLNLNRLASGGISYE
ncbi:MAG: ATP-binding protein [Elusimicrobiota bacterium]